jgi:hypothetical protein
MNIKISSGLLLAAVFALSACTQYVFYENYKD